MEFAGEAERLLKSRKRALAALGPVGDTRSELSEIEAALRRIARGTYGSCERCGGAIGRDRLRALPEVRFCIRCSG
jgi:DnaK suppressor protein